MNVRGDVPPVKRLGDKPAVGKSFRKKTGRRLEKLNVERRVFSAWQSHAGGESSNVHPSNFNFVERNLIASARMIAIRAHVGDLKRTNDTPRYWQVIWDKIRKEIGNFNVEK